MGDAFALPVTINGKRENLIVMKIEWDTIQIFEFDELIVLSAIEDHLLIRSDDHITQGRHTWYGWYG